MRKTDSPPLGAWDRSGQDPERCPLTRRLRRGRKPVLMRDLLCARQLAGDFHFISFSLTKTHQRRVVGVWFGVGIFVCLYVQGA